MIMLRSVLPTLMCVLLSAWCASAQTGANASPPNPREPHFLILPKEASLASRRGPGSLLDRMEKTYAAVFLLSQRLGVATTQPGDPISVAVFDDEGGFQNYAGGVGIASSKDLYGFFDRDAGRVVLLDFTRIGIIPEKRSEVSRSVNPIRSMGTPPDAVEAARRAAILKQGELAMARIDQLEEQVQRTTVQHEVAHAALAAFGVLPRTSTQPAWLNEGLASLFEVSIDPLALDALGTNEFRLDDYLHAARARQLLPWRRLITDDDVFTPGQPASATAYAQAWLLTYWAVFRNATPMSEFIRFVQRGSLTTEARNAAFERIFKLNEDQLASTLKDYASFLSSHRKSN